MIEEDKLLELFELKANIRKGTGKGVARELRRNDCIPAVLYGPQTEPMHLTIGVKSMESAFKLSERAQVLVNLVVTDEQGVEGKKCPAIIKEVHLSPLSKALLHADLLEIDLNKKVKVKIPVEVFGKSKGVELGGLLQLVRRELEIQCMPMQMPERIKLDVSGLGMGDSIHVNDIKIDGIEIPSDVNFTVVTILAPKTAKGDESGEGSASKK